jgi:hypothetical protein
MNLTANDNNHGMGCRKPMDVFPHISSTPRLATVFGIFSPEVGRKMICERRAGSL